MIPLPHSHQLFAAINQSFQPKQRPVWQANKGVHANCFEAE